MRLRILVVADARLPVPPVRYGGTERIVALLCEGLAARGHEVTLMAAEGSRNYGSLVTHRWSGGRSAAARAWTKADFFLKATRQVLRHPDVLIAHCRVDYLLPFLLSSVPTIYTFHNPILPWQVQWLRSRARGPLALVSISGFQRREFDGGDWRTIGNAVDTDLFVPAASPERSYLAFLGRLTSAKGVDIAIRVARRAGARLKIAGNIPEDAEAIGFFRREVAPQFGPDVEWIGEVDDRQKCEFLGNARGLIVPIRWDEPFGIVVPEALSCGTPVLAMARGSMPELIIPGRNGLLASNEAEMAAGVLQLDEIDSQECRRDAVRRFSKDGMVEAYLDLMTSLTSAVRPQFIGAPAF